MKLEGLTVHCRLLTWSALGSHSPLSSLNLQLKHFLFHEVVIVAL